VTFSRRQPPALGQTWEKGLITLAASQELVMGKLPQAPSRLGVMELGGRVATGAAVGTAAARRPPAAHPPRGP
jgi:uncharacterized membrane protein